MNTNICKVMNNNKKKMKKFCIAIIFVIGAIVFQGCVKDSELTTCPQDAAAATIALSIGDMPEVEVRSVATSKERTISDAYLLLFGSDGKYKTGEKVDVATAVTGNGTQKPKIATNLPFSTGDKVVVLANTGATAMPTTLVAGTSTVDDINAAFPSVTWNQNQLEEGLGMPMSGEMIWDWNSTTQKCDMVRAVAKIEVVFDDELGSNDVTKQFYFGNPDFTWEICNVLRPNIGLIYAPAYTAGCVLPSISSDKFTNLVYDTSVSPMPIPEGTSFYASEYNSSVRAKAAVVDATQFATDRTCISLHFASSGYYRVDLFDKKTKKYLDIRRNRHYKITITKVKSAGYPSLSEALANPGSNLEYTVTVDGTEWESETSNGQYLVKTDCDTCAVAVTPLSRTSVQKLLTVACEMPDSGQGADNVTGSNVSTRRVQLVYADDGTEVASDQIKICGSDGFDPTIGVLAPDSDVQLYYMVGSSYDPALDIRPKRVEITYGNIKHCVPVELHVFGVGSTAKSEPGTDTFQYTGGSFALTFHSYIKKYNGDIIPLGFTPEYSTDGGATWSETCPDHVEQTISPVVQMPSAFNVITYMREQDLLLANAGSEWLRAQPSVVDYDLSTNGGRTNMVTANCYLVNAPGTYRLPLVYGNGIMDGVSNPKAYTSTTTGTNQLTNFVNHLGNAIENPYIYNNAGCSPHKAELVWQDHRNLVRNVTLVDEGRYLEFEVPQATISQGNAIVAVCDADGTIMWSWHIWVTDYKLDSDVKTVTNYQGVKYNFMPINLGWCDAGSLKAAGRTVQVRYTQERTGLMMLDHNLVQKAYSKSYTTGNNPYYQWGRKDPMLACVIDDVSGECVDKEHYVVEDRYKFNKQGQGPVTIATSIQFPYSLYNNDANWCRDTYYNLWSVQNDVASGNDNYVVKTIYDPSPGFYCLPASNAFTGFTSNGLALSGGYFGSGFNSPYATFVEYNTNFGWTFYCNRMSYGSCDPSGGTIFFPASGDRQFYGGQPTNVGVFGYCWSAIPMNGNAAAGYARHLEFGSTNVFPLHYNRCAYSLSVRPVRMY